MGNNNTKAYIDLRDPRSPMQDRTPLKVLKGYSLMNSLSPPQLMDDSLTMDSMNNDSMEVSRGPVESEADEEPVQSEHVQSEPVQSEHVQSEPVQSEPVQPEPVQSEPVQPEHVQSAAEVTGPLNEPSNSEAQIDHPTKQPTSERHRLIRNSQLKQYDGSMRKGLSLDLNVEVEPLSLRSPNTPNSTKKAKDSSGFEEPFESTVEVFRKKKKQYVRLNAVRNIR